MGSDSGSFYTQPRERQREREYKKDTIIILYDVRPLYPFTRYCDPIYAWKTCQSKKRKRFFFPYIVQMHRRTLFDDDLGIIEPLNELGIDNDGVVYTGRCLHALFYIWCCLKW